MNPPPLVQEVPEPQISEGGEGSGEAPPSLHLRLFWGCAALMQEKGCAARQTFALNCSDPSCVLQRDKD